MKSKAYLSNIAPRWPLGKQESLFAEHVPGWPSVPTYCDALKPGSRKAHNTASLLDRASMLRPTARCTGDETIFIASLACLSWSVGDFAEVLTKIMERGATLVALDAGLMVPPTASPRIVGQAMKAFVASKRRATGLGARAGAEISAKKRRESTDDAVKRIADRWPLPSREHPTSELLAEAGLSLNTVVDRLGRRPLAQKRRLDAAKRRARRQ